MRLDVGRDTWRSRRLLRWLRRKGIRLGLREAYGKMGREGLWLACLCRSDSAREAVELFLRLTGGKG